MKKRLGILILLVLILVVVAGLLVSLLVGEKGDNKKTNNIQIPNPAAVYCVEKGYEYEIRSNEKGQYGVCVFPDGSECNGWGYYRGECKIGDSLK